MISTFKNIAPYLVSAICVAYALWGIDFSSFISSFTTLTLFPLQLAQGTSICAYLALPLRIRSLSSGQISYATGFQATMICSAINNLLPAKLGEGAKVIVLHSNSTTSVKQALTITFWERFADLNMVISVGLVAALQFSSATIIAPMCSILVALWILLFLFARWPSLINISSSLIPGKRFRDHFQEQVTLLAEKIRPHILGPLILYTILIWTLGFIFYYLALDRGTELGLSTGQIFIVFSASILGRAVPAAPGSIGVYESFVVGALHLMGVPKEQSLAIAVTLHGIQLLLPTLIGASLFPRFAGSSLSLFKRRPEYTPRHTKQKKG